MTEDDVKVLVARGYLASLFDKEEFEEYLESKADDPTSDLYMVKAVRRALTDIDALIERFQPFFHEYFPDVKEPFTAVPKEGFRA